MNEAGTVGTAAGMPFDYFPPFWLVFVSFGKFSSNPHPVFNGSKTASSKPLRELVPNRETLRALSALERTDIENSTVPVNRKIVALKKREEVSEALLANVTRLEKDLSVLLALEVKDYALKKRKYECDELRDRLQDAKQFGDPLEVQALYAELKALRIVSVEMDNRIVSTSGVRRL